MKAFIPAACAVVFMACCIGLRWPLWESAFRSDFSPVSWLSSAQLLAGSVLALRLSSDRSLPQVLGFWLAAALAGLALDEQFMFHEEWKYGCAAWTDACAYEWIRELPTLAIGVLGVGTALWLHRIVRHPLPRTLLWLAISIGVFALAVDQQLPVPQSVSSLEEAFEVLAEAFFLGALLAVPPGNAIIGTRVSG